MKSLKIKVSNEAESKEVQELFFELGCYWAGEKNKDNVIKVTDGWYIFSRCGEMTYCDSSEVELNGAGFNLKEITLQELRDMVVLKRNDPDDANFENEVTGIKYFVSSAGDIYFWCGDWEKCHVSFKIEKLKPIKEDVMKEYLVKTDSGNYLYAKNVSDIAAERVIEIPEWGDYAYKNDTGVYFLKDAARYSQSSLVWQRESLNDKIATAEVARQDVLKPEDFGAVDNVNHPSHYASGGIECIDAMIAAYGVEAVKAYCKCNAFKYQWRFDKKNGNEDILKAQWYQNKYMELSNEI